MATQIIGAYPKGRPMFSALCSRCGKRVELAAAPDDFAKYFHPDCADARAADVVPQHDADPRPDPVNRPPHYTQGKVECIDAIEAALGADGLRAFCRGNAMKYLWRAGARGDLVEDLRKARWYLDREIASRTAASA